MGQAVYTTELAEALCALIAEDGMGPKAACKSLGVAYNTMRSWIARYPDFEAQYDRSMRLWADQLAEQIIEISDSADGSNTAAVQKARLQADNRRWLAAKLLPERFGERVELTGKGGKDLLPATRETRLPQLVQILSVLLPETSNGELFTLAGTLFDRLSAPDEGNRVPR